MLPSRMAEFHQNVLQFRPQTGATAIQTAADAASVLAWWPLLAKHDIGKSLNIRVDEEYAAKTTTNPSDGQACPPQQPIHSTHKQGLTEE